MIRLYSDPMTALEVKRGFARGTIPLTIVTSETDTRGSDKTVQVHFYGELANSVASEVVQGSKFLFRGFIFSRPFIARRKEGAAAPFSLWELYWRRPPPASKAAALFKYL